MAIQPTTLNHRLATPNKLFECLAAGVPVVAGDLPGMRQIVLGDPAGALGALCDPTDPGSIAATAAGLLALDPAERRALRDRCRQAARDRWNWETEGAKLVALYASLGKASGSSPVEVDESPEADDPAPASPVSTLPPSGS
jgi:glycosyltransferase involved in cell wall biosynthesis